MILIDDFLGMSLTTINSYDGNIKHFIMLFLVICLTLFRHRDWTSCYGNHIRGLQETLSEKYFFISAGNFKLFFEQIMTHRYISSYTCTYIYTYSQIALLALFPRTDTNNKNMKVCECVCMFVTSCPNGWNNSDEIISGGCFNFI